MANEEQLALLKSGVEGWNKWRLEKSFSAMINAKELKDLELRIVDLSGVDLSRTLLSHADLTLANLRGAVLQESVLIEANLSHAVLTVASLPGAALNLANLSGVDLCGADLTRANLMQANFSQADLSEANLSQAILSKANLCDVKLKGSDFSKAKMDNTIFGNSDMSEARGLENVVHWGPSHISTGTFARSKGKIPESFLRGCGLSDWEIEEVKLYNPELSNDEVNRILYKIYDLRATQALQISPLFISYSHADKNFVDKMGKLLDEKGLRYWRDTHDMKAGRMEKQIDRAIRQNPTVLLILSEHSLSSDWVEHEVRTGRELEKELSRDVLCPVALDDSWRNSRWPKRVMEQIMEYNILDFSVWKDDVKFEGMFLKLIDGLELFYKG